MFFSFRGEKKGSERSELYKVGPGKMKYPDPAVINYVCIVLKELLELHKITFKIHKI